MINSATSLSSNFNSVHPSPAKLIQMFNESSHQPTLHFFVFPIFFSFCVVLCTIWRFRGATFEDLTFEDPTFEDPTFEDPTFEDLTFEDPTFEDPTFEDPTFEDFPDI
ncbi:hypothetical protein niasHT_004245 [Heterodera trifolii]|uniref:Transmembrane protein n=1 Tax=Heterodera trifolii TaxID=157864 RepID=A0ABD2MCF9_9BILA